MMNCSSIYRLLLATAFSAVSLPGQTPPVPVAAPAKGASDGSISTRKDARTITLKIPAPRGQIVDRDGEPLAQNQVVYQAALQFSQFETADRAYVVSWARARLDALKLLVTNSVDKTDDEIYDHYRHRRWLPLLVTGQISEKDARTIEPKLTSGLMLQPLYRRIYPQGEMAAHIIGYTGRVGKLPTGPINFNEPLWEESEGRSGLETIFNQQLSGEAGMKKLLFDESGKKLQEEQLKRPRPGGTIVTTLNLEWQKIAERTLKNGCRRGAFVVVDVLTGEVLVMASRPSFDLNAFIPSISDVEYTALKDDPSTPLFGRAFQSAYPPASSYKPVVALAALNAGAVTEDSTIYCPASITIDRVTLKNWTAKPEGSIDVKRALARSCNTWFYQVGIDIGPTSFLSLSRRLGFGEKTGLPLVGEDPGLVPTDEWMLAHEKRRILKGDTANLSIGQGSLLATPLQVAQAMAGIANGGALPKLQLIRQIQDTRGKVVQVSVPERRSWLGVDEDNIKVVHQGMKDVIYGGGGTGKNAALGFTTICGKTGTAQWGPARLNQRLAWFAGFLPYEDPRYAYAVVYEGKPGETVSGGRMAAPMVRTFFNSVKGDIKDTISPPKKAVAVAEDEEEGEGEDKPKPQEEDKVPMRAIPVDPSQVTDEEIVEPRREARNHPIEGPRRIEGRRKPRRETPATQEPEPEPEPEPPVPQEDPPGAPGEEP